MGPKIAYLDSLFIFRFLTHTSSFRLATHRMLPKQRSCRQRCSLHFETHLTQLASLAYLTQLTKLTQLAQLTQLTNLT